MNTDIATGWFLGDIGDRLLAVVAAGATRSEPQPAVDRRDDGLAAGIPHEPGEVTFLGHRRLAFDGPQVVPADGEHPAVELFREFHDALIDGPSLGRRAVRLPLPLPFRFPRRWELSTCQG